MKELIDGGKLDLNKNQFLFSIRIEGYPPCYVETKDGLIVTDGWIGYNEYENFIQLLFGLQGHGIDIDKHIFW